MKVHPGSDLSGAALPSFIISESGSGVIDPFLSRRTLAAIVRQDVEVAYKVPRVSFCPRVSPAAFPFSFFF